MGVIHALFDLFGPLIIHNLNQNHRKLINDLISHEGAQDWSSAFSSNDLQIYNMVGCRIFFS